MKKQSKERYNEDLEYCKEIALDWCKQKTKNNEMYNFGITGRVANISTMLKEIDDSILFAGNFGGGMCAARLRFLKEFINNYTIKVV